MELKRQQAQQELAKEHGSNRTFMELKQKKSEEKAKEKQCSNRTFMELKLQSWKWLLIWMLF